MNDSKRQVKVGTRTSPLSLAQTEEVLRQLSPMCPDFEFVTVPITTGGDRNKNAPLLSMARGMFVKEIELALLDGEVDFAVHSAKDIPSGVPEGLVLAAFPQRSDPRDVLVSKSGLHLKDLPPGARLGTSSPRRHALIKALRPDVEVVPIRGNVGTRLEKARGDDYDGAVLAAAGLLRLGWQDHITEHFDPQVFIPDTGQGALAVEARASDEATLEMLARLDHLPTSAAVRAERAFLAAMGGGCKVPVAAYGQHDESGDIHISVMAASPEGGHLFRHSMRGSASDPEAVGRQAAEALIARGAGEIVSRESAT